MARVTKSFPGRIEVEWTERSGGQRTTFGRVLNTGQYEICSFQTRIVQLMNILPSNTRTLRTILVCGATMAFSYAATKNYVNGCDPQSKKSQSFLDFFVHTRSNSPQCGSFWDAIVYTASYTLGYMTSTFLSSSLDNLSLANWVLVGSLLYGIIGIFVLAFCYLLTRYIR